MRPPRSVSTALLGLLALATWPGFFLVVALVGMGLGLIGADQEAVFPTSTVALVTTVLWLSAVTGVLASMTRR